jgi:hypothetical protein
MNKSSQPSSAIKLYFAAFLSLSTISSIAFALESQAPVISPIPASLLRSNVSLDDMFTAWLRPSLTNSGLNRFWYSGHSAANEDAIINGVSRFCESHGATPHETGRGTVVIAVKCESSSAKADTDSAATLAPLFQLTIKRVRTSELYTMVEIWDDKGVGFYQKAFYSRFDGANRLIVRSILSDEVAGVSQAISEGADARMMICNTTDGFLAPAGDVECGPVMRNLLDLQLSEYRKSYAPIAKILLSRGVKWPEIVNIGRTNKTLSAFLTEKTIYFGTPLPNTATQAEREAADIERANGWRDLVKMGLVFNFSDLKDTIARTLGDDGANRNFRLKFLGVFASATNQGKQFDQMVAEFDGMDAASLQRKAHREIGDALCKYERGEVSGIKGVIKTTAFVEDKTPKKLKLRIAGISMGKWNGLKYYPASNTNLGTDTTTSLNSIVWDDPINWRDDCDRATR